MKEAAGVSEVQQAEQDRLLILATHDLRAPLRQSLLRARMMKRETAAKLDAFAAMNLGSLMGFTRVANQLLSRLAEYYHAGSVAASPPADVESVLQNAIRAVGIDADCDVVVGDTPACPVPAAVQAVLVELMTNARKFRRAAVSVQIASRVADGECVFENRDNGIGFAAAYRDHLGTAAAPAWSWRVPRLWARTRH